MLTIRTGRNKKKYIYIQFQIVISSEKTRFIWIYFVKRPVDSIFSTFGFLSAFNGAFLALNHLRHHIHEYINNIVDQTARKAIRLFRHPVPLVFKTSIREPRPSSFSGKHLYAVVKNICRVQLLYCS